MERTDAAMVLPVDIGWSDLGSWSALWDVAERDAARQRAPRRRHRGRQPQQLRARAQRLVALVGVDDLVVVDTDDAVLVARKDRVQQVKDVVAQLKAGQRSQAALHREVHRPWGSYDSVDVGDALPGQAHQGQAGRAAVAAVAHAARRALDRGAAAPRASPATTTCSSCTRTSRPTSRSARSIGWRIPGTQMLELIEVQSGDYLGEDDIVRYDDVYGRA